MLAGIFLGACKPSLNLQLRATQIPNGRSLVFQQITETTTEVMTPGEEPSTTKEVATTDFTYTLTQSNPDGSSEWILRIMRFQQQKTEGDSTDYFDSANTDASSDAVKQAILGAMDSTDFYISLSPNGAVTQLKGWDEVLQRVTASVPPEARPFFQQTMASFKESGVFNFENLWSFYPDKNIKLGKTWKKPQYIQLLNAQKSNRYTLDAQTPETYEIQLEATTTSEAQHPGLLKVGSIEITYLLNGIGSGALTLDKQWGMVRKMYYEERLSGTMGIKVPYLAPSQHPLSITAKTWLEMK